MTKKYSREPRMGRIFIFIGAICKIVQLTGPAVGLSVLGGTFMTLVTSCLIVGGLAVLAIERMNLSSCFALICLASTIGALLPANGYAFSFLFMAISFLSFAVMLITMKRPLRILCGVIIIAGTVLLALHLAGVLTLAMPLVTVLLCLTYGAMGAGLFA